MTQPSFVSQYGPLAAGLFTFIGVLITLLVTGYRLRSESRVRREDEYRGIAREAVARVLGDAYHFRRSAWTMSNPYYFGALEADEAFRSRNEVDNSMLAVSQALINCQLLAVDEQLISPIASFEDCFVSVCGSVYEATDAFWEGRPPRAPWYERSIRFDAYDKARIALRDKAKTILAPTVRRK